MNKSSFSTVLLSMAAAATLFACGEPNNSADGAKAPEAKTADAGTPTSLNIRYIDADSITAHYTLAKEFETLTLNTLKKIDNVGQARSQEIQRLGQSIETKQRNGTYMTQESYEGDMRTLAQKQQDAQNTINGMQARAQQEAMARQIELNDSLESFLKFYNQTHHYDAILFKAAGAYFNPALDITKEVIDGLNARYEQGKKNK